MQNLNIKLMPDGQVFELSDVPATMDSIRALRMLAYYCPNARLMAKSGHVIPTWKMMLSSKEVRDTNPSMEY